MRLNPMPRPPRTRRHRPTTTPDPAPRTITASAPRPSRHRVPRSRPACGGRCSHQKTRQSEHRRRPRVLRRPGWLLATELAVLALLLTASAHAETTHVLAQAASLDVVLNNIRNWLMGILALLATVFLTIGGVRYVMAGGEPGEVEKAKQAFKSAGIGYGLAALAPLVVTILRGIVGV